MIKKRSNPPSSAARSPVIIAIAGPSGSGKSTLAHGLAAARGPEHCQCLELDNYYRDLSHLNSAERAAQDFDHPDAWEGELLVRQIADLKRGHSIPMPQYDFSAHARAKSTRAVSPTPYIILEGLFALCYPALHALIDLAVFIDIPDDVALARRIQRDVIERGRTRESVIQQFETTVRPAAEKYIRPSAQFAHLQLTCHGDLTQNLAQITTYLAKISVPRPD